MPRVVDSTPRRARKVEVDGAAFWRAPGRPAKDFAGSLSTLRFPSVSDSYHSHAVNDTRFATVTDVNDISRILYGSGFDKGNEYHSSRVVEVSALVQQSGNPGSNYFGPQGIGPRTLGFVQPNSSNSIDGYGRDLSGSQSAMLSLYSGVLDKTVDNRIRQVPDASLKTFGSIALAQTHPLTPPANLLTALGELISDGLPPILGKALFERGPKRAGLIAAIGSEYLNYIFGYKPIVDEIFTTLSTIKLMDVYLQQWKRNVGKETRRTFAAKPSSFQYPISFDSPSNSLQVYAFGSPDSAVNQLRFSERSPYLKGQNMRLQAYGSGEYTRDMRFTGAYWYNAEAIRDLNIPEPFASYMGSGDKSAFIDALQKAKVLGLGQGLTEVAWQLLPWSWMIDWFVNIGDIISNANVVLDQNVQLRYGYVTSREVWREDLSTHYSSSLGRIDWFSSITRVRMRRIRATPFGFGTTFEGLSNPQKAVLAALAASFFGGRKR